MGSLRFERSGRADYDDSMALIHDRAKGKMNDTRGM